MGSGVSARLIYSLHTTTATIVTHQTAFTQSWVEVNGKELPIGAFYQQQVMLRLEGRS